MCSLLQQNMYRSQLIVNTDKLYLASQAVIFWAENRLNQKERPLNAITYFPKKNQNETPNIITHGELIDLQARFNLNALIIASDKPNRHIEAQAILFRLMQRVLPKSPNNNHGSIIQAISHWVNNYAAGHGQDDIARLYNQFNPPYSPSHQPMQSISELRLVRGVNANLYATLLPYLTALPPPTPLNLNTASRDMLLALGPHLNETDIDSLIQARGRDGIRALDTIEPVLKKLNLTAEQVTLESQYFLCIATMQMNDRQLIRYTILHRKTDKNGQWMTSILHDNLNDL